MQCQVPSFSASIPDLIIHLGFLLSVSRSEERTGELPSQCESDAGVFHAHLPQTPESDRTGDWNVYYRVKGIDLGHAR
jgi:hypothetical protein